MPKKHLIIGSGQAALSALKEIRQANTEDEIKLVSMENCAPYSPTALVSLLSGKITERALWMANAKYFKTLKASLTTDKEVIAIHPKKRTVTYLDKSSDTFDTLLIASGAGPTKPPIKGIKDVDVYDFRTLADCRRLLKNVKRKSSVVILGAGMVGMEVAGALLERGCKVSIVEKEKNVLPLYFNDEAELYIKDIFTDHKACFFVGREVAGVEKKDQSILITFSDGRTLEADIIINATGVRSRTSFLLDAGVSISHGILVDNCMHTSVDNIYAAGDAAEAPDFFTGKPKMSANIPSAVAQGAVAGANMAGGKMQCMGEIPMTALNFMGNQAFSIGLISPLGNSGRVLKRQDDKKRSFKKLIFDGNRLIGGMFLNERIDPGVIAFLIRNRIDLTAHQEALFEGTKRLSDPWLSSLKSYPL